MLEERINKLETNSSVNLTDSLQASKVVLELSMLYPSITDIQYLSDSIPSLTIISSKKKNGLLSTADKEKLEKYIKYKTSNDSLKIFYK